MSILDKLTATQRAALAPETLAEIEHQSRLHNWVDYSLPANEKDSASSAPDFSTLRAKLDFIRQHGEEAYLVALTKWQKSGASAAQRGGSLNFM